MKETYHVTFSEDDEAISKPSIDGDEINFNENKSFPDDEFLVPGSKNINSLEFTIDDDHPIHNEPDDFELADNLKPAEIQDSIINEPINEVKPSPTIISPLAKAASAHECLYVNFLSEIEPKKLIESLKEKGWIIIMQEELNQFERNKAWTLVPMPYGKTIIGTKWIFSFKMDENGVVIKNKARLVS
nr:retrovirus-related Pol polyprotein from transposon TNT 1-94 [Tanacetum cinerariifolium]